eukprot:2058071-Amphidinium_carterae.1
MTILAQAITRTSTETTGTKNQTTRLTNSVSVWHCDCTEHERGIEGLSQRDGERGQQGLLEKYRATQEEGRRGQHNEMGGHGPQATISRATSS